MSILLDPRTHDPLFDEDGRLSFIEDFEGKALQNFRVWINTGPGTDMLKPEFGFDLRSVQYAPYGPRFGYEKALMVQFAKLIDDLPNIFSGVTLVNATQDGNELVVELKLSLVTGQITSTTVRLTE